jgi:hypothetical protein
MIIYIAHNSVSTVISHRGEVLSSYITAFDSFRRWFFYIGVQMAHPFLIISRIKKVARKEQLGLKVYAMLSSNIRPASLRELSECLAKFSPSGLKPTIRRRGLDSLIQF